MLSAGMTAHAVLVVRDDCLPDRIAAVCRVKLPVPWSRYTIIAVNSCVTLFSEFIYLIETCF